MGNEHVDKDKPRSDSLLYLSLDSKLGYDKCLAAGDPSSPFVRASALELPEKPWKAKKISKRSLRALGKDHVWK